MSEETAVQEETPPQPSDIVSEICKVIDQAIKLGFSSFEVLGALEIAKSITVSYFMDDSPEETGE